MPSPTHRTCTIHIHTSIIHTCSPQPSTYMYTCDALVYTYLDVTHSASNIGCRGLALACVIAAQPGQHVALCPTSDQC